MRLRYRDRVDVRQEASPYARRTGTQTQLSRRHGIRHVPDFGHRFVVVLVVFYFILFQTNRQCSSLVRQNAPGHHVCDLTTCTTMMGDLDQHRGRLVI